MSSKLYAALITCIVTLTTSPLWAEMITLEQQINQLRNECAGYVELGRFKGEDISAYSLETDYFYIKADAIESFKISRNGQIAHLFARHEVLCAGLSMNDFCGSSGCEYALIVNDNVFNLRGRFVEIVESSVGPVILLGRAGANCGPYSNAAPCVQAYIWDEDNLSLNAMRN